MAFEPGSEFVVKQAGRTHIAQEQPVSAEFVAPSCSEKTAVRAIDTRARGYFKTIERSFSFSALERNTFSGEDPSAMTIDFLRARLQAQRADYRAEKQRAQQLAQKVLELEHKLSMEVQLRKKAERINMDISIRHESHSIGSNNVLLHNNNRADKSNKNSEEYRDTSGGVTRSTSRENFSSFAIDDDYFSNGGAEGHVNENHNHGDKGQLREFPWQYNHYWESLRSSSTQNKDRRQISDQFLPEHPSAVLKKEFNAMPSHKDSHNGRWMGNKETRSQQSSFPNKQRPDQAADHVDSHLLHREEQSSKNNLELKKMQNYLMQEPQYSAQQQVEKASQTWEELVIQKNLSESFKNQNDRQQFPLDMGNEEDSPEEITQDRITGVTYASVQHLEGLDVHLQGTCGPMSGAESTRGLPYPNCFSAEISDAKDSNQNIEEQSETLILSVKDHKTVELKEAAVLDSETLASNRNPCLNDTGVASTPKFFQKENDFYRPQYETLNAKIENTAEKQDKADSMATDVTSTISNTEKEDKHFGVINSQVFEGSGIKTNTTERELNLNKTEIEGGYQSCSKTSGSQCGKQMQGWPTDVGECNRVSSFKFDVQTEYSNGKITKEDLVLKSSHTKTCMSSSNQEPGEPDPSPVLIWNQQNRTQRKARNMGEQSSKYSTERRGVTGSETFETDVSQGQLSENAEFAGEMHPAGLVNLHHPIPLSRFNKRNQPIQDLNSSLHDFPRDLTKQSFARDRRDQVYYPQAAHGSRGLPCRMDSSSSGAGGIVTSTHATSHNDGSPFVLKRTPYKGLYTRNGQEHEYEFAPDVVKGVKTSSAEMPSICGSADRYSRLVSPSGGRNLSSHDRLHDYRVSRPNSCNDFPDDKFSMKRIGGQEIEALEPREMGRHVGYGQHKYYFETETQGRLPLHVSPLTERIEPDFLPPPRAAIPKHFSTLPNEVGRCARLDLDLMGYRKSLDGGFDKVREILKALEVAKQHMQTSKEPMELPGHLKEPSVSVEKAGRKAAGSKPELPVQNPNSSQFLVEAVPQHAHLPSHARMPKYPHLPSQTRPHGRPSF